MLINLEIENVQALYFHDKENKLHTLSTIEKGGVLISGDTLEEAKIMFKNALKLARAVKFLLNSNLQKRNFNFSFPNTFL